MIDGSGFYVPPQREREYSNEGERILIRWMPGMPRENAYEGLPNDQGDIVIHAGEITGIVRRNDVVPTPKSRYHEEKRVADIELDMPELAWHKKILTLWCDHEMLEDAMAWAGARARRRYAGHDQTSWHGKAQEHLRYPGP